MSQVCGGGHGAARVGAPPVSRREQHTLFHYAARAGGDELQQRHETLNSGPLRASVMLGRHHITLALYE